MAKSTDNIPFGEKLRIFYNYRRVKAGLSWFGWVESAVKNAEISITEATDLIAHIYGDDEKRDLYNCVVCLRLYQRLDKPMMIERLIARARHSITQYL